MVFHVLRHRAPTLDEDQLGNVEERLRGLAAIPSVEFLSVSRDGDDSKAIVLMIVFESTEALKSYRTHPAHLETVSFLRELPLETTRINVEVKRSDLAAITGALA
ncbi:MAG: Dabb family protein [Acidimicrobiales bacterium]